MWASEHPYSVALIAEYPNTQPHQLLQLLDVDNETDQI